MGAGIETDVQVMAKAAQDAIRISAELRATASSMGTQLSVLHTAWVGAGGTAFTGAQERVQADMGSINAALARLGGLLSDAGQQYVSGDDESSQQVTRAGAEAGSITTALKF
ncbi:hypothetical protein GCM10027290_62260 [Micromonospora sonneratiae]|uniref:WXG100 family type VII secretion target n=1 Tax=Micromonospora sonneratiae TaxID=1184706 RepID=A0ABW3YFA5_9ACTN